MRVEGPLQVAEHLRAPTLRRWRRPGRRTTSLRGSAARIPHRTRGTRTACRRGRGHPGRRRSRARSARARRGRSPRSSFGLERLGLARIRACDHELVPGAQRGREPSEAGDHPLHVLAEVGTSDVQHKAGAYRFELTRIVAPTPPPATGTSPRNARLYRVDHMHAVRGNLEALHRVLGGVLRQCENAVNVTDQLYAPSKTLARPGHADTGPGRSAGSGRKA